MLVVMSCHQINEYWLIDCTLGIIGTGVIVWHVTPRHSSLANAIINTTYIQTAIYGSIGLLLKQHECLSSTQVRNGSNANSFIDVTSIESNTVMSFTDHGIHVDLTRTFSIDISPL